MDLDDYTPMNDNDDSIIGLSGRDKEKLTYREIALRGIEECRIQGSKEMVRGGEVKVVVNGQQMTMTKPDQRKLYMEVVDSLYDLFYYYIKKVEKKIEKEEEDTDDKKKTKEKKPNAFEKINMEIAEVYKGLVDKFIKSEPTPKDKKYAEEVGMFPPTPNGTYFSEMFQDTKLKIYRKKFRLLLKVFKDSNELKSIIDLKPY